MWDENDELEEKGFKPSELDDDLSDLDDPLVEDEFGFKDDEEELE